MPDMRRTARATSPTVMPGLIPGIYGHAGHRVCGTMDPRVKPEDDERSMRLTTEPRR